MAKPEDFLKHKEYLLPDQGGAYSGELRTHFHKERFVPGIAGRHSPIALLSNGLEQIFNGIIKIVDV